tara:strand:+ start:410 stop:613 length:204 start_codon:yes stop_codon:yes gene_type:complete
MNKEDNAVLNILLFICFILCIFCYETYRQKEETKKLLLEARKTIELQERAIYTQKLYTDIFNQIYRK